MDACYGDNLEEDCINQHGGQNERHHLWQWHLNSEAAAVVRTVAVCATPETARKPRVAAAAGDTVGHFRRCAAWTWGETRSARGA